ncbi:hypothetical protein CWS72_24915 [Telmatospirillum siberiense]|uniref:Uncharacterized protein n=1 Tax=Telmatospirillum siberiense TaxID=382514 RepID=A0A2N3PN58_9PROT|nr:hypothetical protein CWS72_24915 [Telmatospirillum siberiense]
MTQAGLASPEAVVAAVCMARRLGPTRMETLMNSRRAESFLLDLTSHVRKSNMRSLESAEEIQRALKEILDPLITSYFRA